ncbi:MAG: ribosome small subunit-dependent GTPase A [Pseudomonadota bacterium]
MGRPRETRESREAIPPLTAGRVVANHGREVKVAGADGVRLACRLHGRKLEAVCGDEVRYGHASSGDVTGTVYEILPRRRSLSRLTGLGRSEAIVANLTQLVAVAATVPSPDWNVIDRYLAGAEWAGIKAVVIFNKCELGISDTAAAELASYAALGYPVVHSSTRAAPGIEGLVRHLAGEVSVLVGQSGTGKSSLLNALAPEAHAITQEISAATEEGRHTTTHAALHVLSSGGDLIDSPGVRDYAPPLPQVRDISSGFIEIAAAALGCKFQDCMHNTEPGCQVRREVEAGVIRRRRFDSYRHLVTMGREFDARFPERRRPPARVR